MKLIKLLTENHSKRIVLIACAATKADHPAPAKDLYISPLFKKSLQYAYDLKPDAIYILSAKHYLVPLDKELAPYNVTLLDFSADEVKQWSSIVAQQLSKKYDLKQDQFIFLAGEKYRKYLEPYMAHTVEPLKGLRIGQQLAWYTKKLAKKISETLKKFINFIS